MSAAQEMTFNIEELIESIDRRWREKIQLQDLGDKVIATEDGNAIIGLASTAEPTLLLDLALNKGLKQICQLSNSNLQRELNTSASMLLTPELFIKYPLSTILNPTVISDLSEQSLTGFQVDFSKASEKESVLESLGSYLRKHIKAESLIDDIKSVADELFTNAVFNAPFVDKKTNVNEEKDRSDLTIEIPHGKTARLFVGVLENQLVIGCSDPFGSLRVSLLLQRILTCYQDGLADSMRMEGKGGAGIGSYMVYNASASYYVGVERGVSTVVCCLVPVNMSSRKRNQIAKNMHFFEIEGRQK